MVLLIIREYIKTHTTQLPEVVAMIQPQLTNLEERHELLLNRYKDLQNNINQRQETHF